MNGSVLDSAETRHICTGGVSKSELLQRLENASVRLNGYARALFDDHGFTPSTTCTSLTVVFVELADIGLPEGGRYAQIMDQAAQFDLQPCPLELGPHLRLEYRDQPVGPYLTIASLEIRPGPETPNGFYLRNIDGELWLRGYESGPENTYAPDFTRFAFVKSPSESGEVQ